MLRSHPALLLVPTLLCLSACATTTFTSTWKTPDGQTINPAGKTVAAVFVSDDERTRHTAEDALANELIARGAHGVPGYTLLPNEIGRDAEDTFARLKEAGANEVVVMRVVGADRRPAISQIGVPGFAADEEPGIGNSIRVINVRDSALVVSVETLVYSLNRDELLWSSTSRTTNPQDIAHLVNEVANASAKEMVKQGLLARQ
jgi:hypothetical protein